ncbi:MAG: glutathione S-transferase [Candidatus Azotimanducaceae bacterium]|jgi:glutathione S-transferase
MTIKLHRHALSGHSHRVELFLSILGLESEIVDVDLANGAHKQVEYLEKNIFGQVPVIEDGDSVLSDSNAILVYLAAKYDDAKTWMPTNPQEAAEVQRFLSVSADKIAHGPAAARLVNVFGAALDHQQAIDTSHNILSTLNKHLAERQWLSTNRATIADLANYAYIKHAPEGDVSLDDYPNIQKWLARIENLTGFVPMQATKIGLAA